MVLIYHCNDGLGQLNRELFYDFPILQKGTLAVHFFFVLSGYLLTYLACHEFRKQKSFNILAFFKRRILRIAPLYYLSVFSGLLLIGFIYPRVYGSDFASFKISEALPYYLFFLPNYPIVVWDKIGPLFSLWSIGVEEQFYLFFPIMILLGFLTKRTLLVICLSCIAYTSFYYLVDLQYFNFQPSINKLITKTLKFHFILFGCVLGAILFYYPQNYFYRLIEKRWIQLVSILCLIGYLIFIETSYDPDYLIGGILFSIVMINVSKPNSILDLEINPLIYLGAISYGIYVFHPFVSIGLRFLAQKIEFINQIIFTVPLIFYLLVLGLTITVSHISFKYFESYFLRMKSKV